MRVTKNTTLEKNTTFFYNISELFRSLNDLYKFDVR